MSFKNLNLNQSSFDTALSSCPNVSTFTKDVKTQLTRYNIDVEGKKALLNVHFNKNGTTTINPKVGQEQELSLNIATFLKDSLSISDIEKAEFSISGISNEDFLLLKEYLNDCNITETLINKTNGEKIRFTSRYKDTITITRYSNGNTQFQGKPLYVFSEIKNFLIDILDIKEIIDIENEVYKVDINIEDIKTELSMILVNSISYLCPTTTKMLSSALTLRKIDVEMEDYTAFASPALRAMEGYLKKTLQEKGVVFNGNTFNHFEKVGTNYNLKNTHKIQVNCDKTVNCVEKCYNYYNANRHSLSHVSNISSTTRILSNKNEAVVIINNIFKLIEETYNERISS